MSKIRITRKTCPDCYSVLQFPIVIPNADYSKSKIIERCATCFWRKVEWFPPKKDDKK